MTDGGMAGSGMREDPGPSDAVAGGASRLPLIDESLLERARAADRVAALTGAGVSAASGIPTFRGPGGFWRGHDPMTLATAQGFAADPKLVWDWYAWRRELIDSAQPNPAHTALADLERRLGADCFTLVTQNVDGLHRRAGSERLLELHGAITRAKCWGDCGRVWDWSLPLDVIPPHCACGALARPAVIWFGEMLDMQVITQAQEVAATAELLLVVGTSAVVEPAASLPLLTRHRGGIVIEMNPEETPLSSLVDLHIGAAADEMMPALVDALSGACR